MKGVEVVAEILKREGTEFIACYPANPLIEACAKAGIRPVLCRQERVGLSIADGFSRTTNGQRIGVFVSQNGPGTENAFPGAAQAFSDNVPILLLPGGEPTSRAYVKPSFSAVDNYRNVTKWIAQINQAGRIPELMRRAYYALRTGKGGPVLLEFPRDVMQQEFEGEIDYTPVKGNRSAPDASEVREVATVLANARRLVIHAGQGVLFAGATEQLRQLAELLDAPVMTTMPGKSSIPENHPLALGASSVSTTKPVSHFLQQADVVFGIGTSFTRTNYGKTIPPGKVMVHSTNDPSDVHKNYKADYALIGDAKLVLQALLEELGEGSGARHGTADEVASVKKDWLGEWNAQLTSDEVPINQYRIIHDLVGHLDRNNVVVTHDAGSPRDQVVPFWESLNPRSYLGWGKSTQLGYGLGMIMGAKLAEPSKTCINFMGDAAIGMVGMDIETAVRNRIGIITVVFNNGIMAIERKNMPYTADKYQGLGEGGNYRDVARGLGAWSERVEKPADLLRTFDQAMKVTQTGQPALVECIVKEGYDFSLYP